MLHELDAALLLLPELEVSVAAGSHDEVRLGGDAVSYGITVPV